MAGAKATESVTGAGATCLLTSIGTACVDARVYQVGWYATVHDTHHVRSPKELVFLVADRLVDTQRRANIFASSSFPLPLAGPDTDQQV